MDLPPHQRQLGTSRNVWHSGLDAKQGNAKIVRESKGCEMDSAFQVSWFLLWLFSLNLVFCIVTLFRLSRFFILGLRGLLFLFALRWNQQPGTEFHQDQRTLLRPLALSLSLSISLPLSPNIKHKRTHTPTYMPYHTIPFH